MEIPDSLLCEHCGDDSRVVLINGNNEAGFPTQRPKSTTRDSNLYIFIDCPKWGEREQCISPSCDTPRNGLGDCALW